MTLHEIIQAAMGWLDYHLWEFTVGERRLGPSIEEGWETAPSEEAAKVTLREVLNPGNRHDRFRTTKIGYVYDFGDNWHHRLTVSHVRGGEPGVAYPRYIAGERNAPPEDCGGTPGFYEMLEAAANPIHPSHAEITEWLDGYNPEIINERAITSALTRIARRLHPKGAKAAKAKPQN
jgi:hypothetical protein